jgi:hypothetical protein
MDSRLQRVGGTRLVRLRYSDAPRVARAILDKFAGKARVLSGISRDTPYVEFVRPNVYTVVVRGDDWRKIFPFLRYGSGAFNPVITPGIPPARIPSPQPNRDRVPPPVNPGTGLRSFLEHFDYFEYQKIQSLLTASRLGQEPGSSSERRVMSGPVDWIPQSQQLDGLDAESYNRLVDILQQLFPTDFPI